MTAGAGSCRAMPVLLRAGSREESVMSEAVVPQSATIAAEAEATGLTLL